MLRKILAQCLIHHCGVLEYGSHIRVKKDYVCALHVTLIILSSDTTAQIHLRDVIFFRFARFLIHKIAARLPVPFAP